VLWYSGGTLPPAWETGIAYSLDGVNWTRGGRLISEGPPGAFDDESADYAAVIADGYEFDIWYSGHDGANYAIGYATAEMCGPGTRVDEVVHLPLVLNGWDGPTPCPPYYVDDFSDDKSGWPIDDNADRRYAYTGGEYQIEVKNPSGGWAVTPGLKAVDFTVAVSMRRMGGTDGSYGIEFGINESWSEWYEVLIYGDTYSIWRFDGSWIALRSWTTSAHIATGTGWNRLKVVRDGTSIAVYVNGHHLDTVTDGTLTGLGRIALLALSTSYDPLDARYDDLALYPASCGAVAESSSFDAMRPETLDGPGQPVSPFSSLGAAPRRQDTTTYERERRVGQRWAAARHGLPWLP
jgi:hypothetical protein